MGAEDLDERNLEGGDLAMEKDIGEIELHLKTDVDLLTLAICIEYR